MIRKFVELKSLKTSDKGSGTIEGYRATYSIDEGGDLIVKGAFAQTIPEYLSSGFTAESHDWSFSKAVGFPIEAKEDEHGFFVKSQFHSTSDAQDIRTKARERMEAGKTVGFSFGYKAEDFSFIEARDYERELPRYVKSNLAYNIAQAKRFPRIRLLKQLSVIEDSLVTSPMNKLAGATGVKSGGRPTTNAEIARLRSEGLRLRMQSLYLLNGFSPELDAATLRAEGKRLRYEALRTLYP